tara:strand:+ start:590 stop:1369 length:780 start_codon:yes stop_codon:yes gene_type:complete
MRSKLVVVFDLDKTIGYFTQIAVVLEAIEDILGRELQLKEFYYFLDTYSYVFRDEIFKIMKYLKRKKNTNKNVRVMIYTNNMGPKSWVYKIKKYIEYKINYKLFDRVIAAWKVGKEIYEPKRTTHNKTYKDLLRCSRLTTNDKILFLDDMDHEDLRRSKQVNYLKVDEYQPKKEFNDLISTFLKSPLMGLFSKKKLVREILKVKLENNIRNSWYPKKRIRYRPYKGIKYYNDVRRFLESYNKNTKRKRSSRTKTKKIRF